MRNPNELDNTDAPTPPNTTDAPTPEHDTAARPETNRDTHNAALAAAVRKRQAEANAASHLNRAARRSGTRTRR